MAPYEPDPETEALLAARDRELRETGGSRSHTLNHKLDEMFEMHRPQLVRFCAQWTKDRAMAEEIAQETLVRAWQQLPNFDGRVAFKYWIFGIARNLCRNARRKHGELLTEDGVLKGDGVAASALSGMRANERSQLLQEASLAALDELEQETVHLRYVEGMSYQQITELLELPGSGSRAVLQRCRRKLGVELRARLAALGHGESLFDESIDV